MATNGSNLSDGLATSLFSQNSTSPQDVSQKSTTPVDLRASYETVLASMCLLLIIVVALVGNVAVIAGIRLQHTLRADRSNLLIINLSITDLTSTVFVMLGAFVSIVMDEWPFGRFLCDCACALNYSLIIVSMLTLCFISIDRYQAVMHPLSYEGRVTRKRLIAVIVYAWLQGLVFGIAPAVSDWVSYDYWEAICAIQWHLYRPGTIIYVVTAFVCCFLGPGMVLVYCYVKILKEVKKQKMQVLAMQTHSKANNNVNKTLSDKTRLVWSLLIVVFAYFICTAPFSVTKLIKVSVDDVGFIPGPINLVSALLGYIASAINPLIYGIFRRDFRRAYIRLLKRICIQKCSQYPFFNSETTLVGRKNPNSYWSEYDNLTLNKGSVDTNMTEIQKAMSQTPMSVSQINISASNALEAIEERSQPTTPKHLNNDEPANTDQAGITNKNSILHNGVADDEPNSLPCTVEGKSFDTGNQIFTTTDQPMVNEAQPNDKDNEKSAVKENNTLFTLDNSVVDHCRADAHYQIIVVKSLIETNDRSKY